MARLFNPSAPLLDIMLHIHNEELKSLIRPEYSLDEVRAIRKLLKKKGTLDFTTLDTGLFPAANTTEEARASGHQNVWLRDNIHVAFAHYFTGDIGPAVKCVQALKQFYKGHRSRFEEIVRGEVDPADPMNRPHVRFDGVNLKENEAKWAHAQNDAIGIYIWLYCLLAQKKHLSPQREDLELLALFVLYFQTIEFHKDEDSGPWGEARKLNASSVGMVTAGLESMYRLLYDQLGMLSVTIGEWNVVNDMVKQEIQKGKAALGEILPFECNQDAPAKKRRYDAALLFLLFPTELVSGDLADQIVEDVTGKLRGEVGIRRYLADSYWCADYREKLSAEKRSVDFSDDIAARDALLEEGQEAQWCLFDSTLSSILGLKYRETGQADLLVRQTEYLNRALGQVTGEDCPAGAFKCPSAYFLEKGEYVPTDTTPLLWSQANLMAALQMMEKSLTKV